MKKWVCTVCGYVYEGENAPAECPQCHVPAEKFQEMVGERTWAAEHVVGVAQGVSEDIIADLRANFEGECSEVGMYLAMARVAHREAVSYTHLYIWSAIIKHSPRFQVLCSNNDSKLIFLTNSIIFFLICFLFRWAIF